MRCAIIAVSALWLFACATGGSDVPQDMLLADQGYYYMTKGDYDRAEANLNVALSINSRNPYALLNLGVLYQDTGQLDKAREMYQRLIKLNPDAVAVRSTSREFDGKRLVEIARENLAALPQ